MTVRSVNKFYTTTTELWQTVVSYRISTARLGYNTFSQWPSTQDYAKQLHSLFYWLASGIQITSYLLSKVWSNISMRKHFVKVLNLPGNQPTWSRGQTTGSCEHHIMADYLLGGRMLYILPRNNIFCTVKVSNRRGVWKLHILHVFH